MIYYITSLFFIFLNIAMKERCLSVGYVPFAAFAFWNILAAVTDIGKKDTLYYDVFLIALLAFAIYWNIRQLMSRDSNVHPGTKSSSTP